jgi:uncharacterized membrane protein
MYQQVPAWLVLLKAVGFMVVVSAVLWAVVTIIKGYLTVQQDKKLSTMQREYPHWASYTVKDYPTKEGRK